MARDRLLNGLFKLNVRMRKRMHLADCELALVAHACLPLATLIPTPFFL